MANLPAWVLLSLREPMTDAVFVERAAALGVNASVTRDGIQLPGAFLARIEGPLEPRLLDRSIAEGPVELGPATLAISGGSNELARESHQRWEADREIRKNLEERMAAIGVTPQDSRIESAASRKMRELTGLVNALAPLASAVVLPKANHLAVPTGELTARAAGYIGGTSYHFPLWSYLKTRDDEGCRTLSSVGMWTFGLPDVAMPAPAGMDTKPLILALGALQREMVAEGNWFSDCAEFETDLGVLRIRRAWDGLFAVPTSWEESSEIERCYDRFVRLNALSALLGDHTLFHIPAGKSGIALEHFLRSGGRGIASTNGMSDYVQPGSRPEDGNERIEVSVSSPDLGPWANWWLSWAAQSILGHPPDRPIRARDRLVLPEPRNGIAGAIAWDFGHLAPQRLGEPRVELWDLIPFTPEELAAFRASPEGQRNWMDERIAKNDFGEIQKRWAPPR